MSELTVDTMIGRLGHDIVLICDNHGIVNDANPVARRLLGQEIIGHTLESLFSEMALEKGKAFLQSMHELHVGDTSKGWELVFQFGVSNQLTISVRGGIVEPGLWVIVGMCEPPQLTAIYHEVLSINSELTNLIRQLNKEQARLAAQIERLLKEQGEKNYGNQHL